ncbi:MAG: LytTR family DNA-binding domain-containing protein [Ferruginibacter sp.]
MKIDCIIIEDEPLAMERIRAFVKKSSLLHLLAVFDSGTDALAFLRSNDVGLIFLDINIGAISGIQLLETNAIRSQVIITTAYQEYALKGFDLAVTDYLMKPFTFERFTQAVNKVITNLSRSVISVEKKFIFIKTEYRLEKIFLHDILYIEGMRDYRKIHTINKKIMTLQTFRSLEEEIPPAIICRVHKSYMVALDKIDAVEKDMIRIKDISIPVSETFKRSFFELIGSK